MFISWQPLHDGWVQFWLSLPVYTVGLWFFGKSAYHSLKGGVSNMDVLIFMGASSAFFYSIYGTITFYGTHDVHKYLFYETGATVITFVLLGNMIEKRSVKKTTNAIEALNSLQVKTAKRVINHNNHEHIETVNVTDLNINDIILVNNGDSIAADGDVIFGNGHADESMLTGESLPNTKNLNDAVFAGTILTNGSLKIKVTKTINNTVLAGIINLVKNAAAKKPNVQKLGDKISAVFVPIVISISIVTFLVTYFWLNLGSAESMLRAVAVLVISCPCAMGLATPTAVMVGIGKAARNGILIKGGSTLEEFAKAKTIIFDKTGTLTTGNFLVTKLMVLDGNENELKNIIYNLEQHSSHPIAKSIVQNNTSWLFEPIVFSALKEIKGMGMEAILPNGDNVIFGSNKIQANLSTDYDLYLLINQKPVAVLIIEDELKENAAELVDYFNQQHFNTVVLSGDNKAKVEALQENINVKLALAQQLPQQKLQYIENLAQQEPTVMLGDGINDAPALTKVNVGISFSKATDIARQSAQIVLMKPDLIALKHAHIISKQTYSTIKQNLFWAFFYNVLCIPLAAAGFLHPIFGAISMALSDVVVIGNSLRLGIRKLN